MNNFLTIKYLLPLAVLAFYLYTLPFQFSSNEIIILIIFLLAILRLIYNSKNQLVVKEILISLLILQYAIAPMVVYYKFNNDVGDFGYEMKIDKNEYFSYLYGAIIAISAGLFMPLFQTKKINQISELFNTITKSTDNFKIGINLIIIGFLTHFIVPFLPSKLAFLAIFLTNLKYVGLFYIYFSKHPYKFIYIALVLSFLVLNIVSGGVFIDLFIWGLFIASYFIINKKISVITKIAVLVIGVFTALLIQSIKADYRKEIWAEDKDEEIQEEQVFINLTSTKLQNATSLFEEDNLKAFFSRINQGWILSNVLNHVPRNQDFAHGELFKRELQGILLPRIIAPNKVTASGKDVKEKFIKYTGRILHGSTTMNVGLISDGYINFGKFGSWIFMFCIGLFINFIIYKIYSISKAYPTLILWLPILFFYLYRTGNDFYMIMNYLVKSSMLLFVTFYIFKKTFYKPQLV